MADWEMTEEQVRAEVDRLLAEFPLSEEDLRYLRQQPLRQQYLMLFLAGETFAFLQHLTADERERMLSGKLAAEEKERLQKRFESQRAKSRQ